jgi:hypothetical protein
VGGLRVLAALRRGRLPPSIRRIVDGSGALPRQPHPSQSFPASSLGFRCRVAALLAASLLPSFVLSPTGTHVPAIVSSVCLRRRGGGLESPARLSPLLLLSPRLSSLVWSAFAVARRTSTLHGHRLCVAIHRLLRRADSSAGSHGTSPPPDQTVPGLARQHPGCCHWPSFRRTNVHSSRTLTLFVFFTQSRQI